MMSSATVTAFGFLLRLFGMRGLVDRSCHSRSGPPVGWAHEEHVRNACHSQLRCYGLREEVI